MAIGIGFFEAIFWRGWMHLRPIGMILKAINFLREEALQENMNIYTFL
jgi:hypothetical protein